MNRSSTMLMINISKLSPTHSVSNIDVAVVVSPIFSGFIDVGDRFWRNFLMRNLSVRFCHFSHSNNCPTPTSERYCQHQNINIICNHFEIQNFRKFTSRKCNSKTIFYYNCKNQWRACLKFSIIRWTFKNKKRLQRLIAVFILKVLTRVGSELNLFQFTATLMQHYVKSPIFGPFPVGI